MKNGSWFHVFGEDRPVNPIHHVYPRPPETAPPDFAAIMTGWWAETKPEKMDEFATLLGVTAQALRWLRVAWAEERQCIAFPMYDGTSWNGDVPCGVRLRALDGKKFAVTGSKSGIFIPYGAMVNGLKMPARRIFVCEGPTDTTACLDMGLFAFGRASCRGGEEMLVECIMQLDPREVVVCCDNDSPGVEGANLLMDLLTMRKVRFIPPGKDLRAFAGDGGNAALLDTMLKNLLWS